MSLDAVILDDCGHPMQTVAIDLDAHAALMQFACVHELKLLLRMEDYYCDTAFNADELDRLQYEIDDAKRTMSDSLGLRVLTELKNLVSAAKSKGTGISMLAD